MWTRAELKSSAKNVLKKNYWLAFVVSLAAMMIIGVPSGTLSSIYQLLVLANESYVGLIFPIMFVVMVFTVFLGAPVVVGKNMFYLSNREKNAEFTLLFSGFTKDNYLNIVKIIFLMQLRVYLWSLLLFIPGIIKTFEYIMIPYILAENPSISTKRAFEISKAMTSGHKFRILVLNLSFIGWILLGTLGCFVGVYFVVPYIEATFAELYTVRREEVLASGNADSSELCGIS